MKQSLDTRTKLLTKNPISLMIELSIPAVLGMVVVGLYNMMDSIFVGQMVGAAQMGAVSVSYPFTLINAGSAAMLGVGSASVLSRAIGKKDERTIKKIMGNLVAMVLLLSVIYTIVGMVFTRQLLSLAGASDNILNYAEKYLRIVFAGSLFVNFFQSANMVIRGEGQLKKAMTIIASGAILNIILDPIFITVLKPYGLGIEAAAYATVFSQFVQAVITLWYFRKKSPNVKIGRIRIDGELLPQVLSVGVSALLMQILTLVQQTVIYRVAANYGGENSQILLGAALRFWNFSFVPLWGISQGFQPAAGTNYGAKEYDRVKTLTRVFIVAATILSLVFYIPAELFPGKVLSMFITTPGVAASGATNFRIMFSTYILQGSFLIAVTLFQSLGKANKATWLVLFRQIILFIPLCIVLAYKMRLEAMKRQAGRPPKENASPLATNLPKGRSDEELGELVGESKDQIRRYIRLTELVPEILQMVDDRQIAFRPAVEISYLPEEQQYTLLEAMEYSDATPSLAQAIKMKKFMQDDKLTDEVIQSIMEEEKPNQREKPAFRDERIIKLIPKSIPRGQESDFVVKALEFYNRHLQRSKDRER